MSEPRVAPIRRAVDMCLANPVVLAVEVERYLSIWIDRAGNVASLEARAAYAECAADVLRAFVAASGSLRPAGDAATKEGGT